MEFGPRALGNRSILADPRRPEMHERVNRLKGRELWRPLAPSVLAERASEFFDLRQASPFMLFRANVKLAKRSVIPAVVHVDGSARPQTVTREQNAFFFDLISAFDRRSGIPVLLNTSFNTAGEPMVCTPEDAIKTFLATGLDLLVLDDFLVRRLPPPC
jgi:carbamoyltransferase